MQFFFDDSLKIRQTCIFVYNWFIKIIDDDSPIFTTTTQDWFRLGNTSLNAYASYCVCCIERNMIYKAYFSTILFHSIDFNFLVNQCQSQESEFLIECSANTINSFGLHFFQLFSIANTHIGHLGLDTSCSGLLKLLLLQWTIYVL